MNKSNRKTNSIDKGSIEAVLFSNEGPISILKLSKLFDVKFDEMKRALDEYSNILLNDRNRGLILIRDNNENVQLATKPIYSNICRENIEYNIKEDLSQPSLETLSIIAYLGPISKSKIDYIRGVNSSYILRSLLIRGLISRKLSKSENEYKYDITIDLLKHLGVSNIKDLPNFNKFHIIKNELFNE